MPGLAIRCALLVAACVASVPAGAQDAGSRSTREFVQAAAASDTFEILEAQTVLTQSADAQVRAFAQQMIQAHRQTSQSLADAAARSGLKPPPMAMSDDQAHMLGAIQGVNGAEFDRTYVHQQVLAHRSALVTEQGYAAGGDTPAVRQAAATAVPVIASHLAMAEQLSARLGGS